MYCYVFYYSIIHYFCRHFDVTDHVVLQEITIEVVIVQFV